MALDIEIENCRLPKLKRQINKIFFLVINIIKAFFLKKDRTENEPNVIFATSKIKLVLVDQSTLSVYMFINQDFVQCS